MPEQNDLESISAYIEPSDEETIRPLLSRISIAAWTS